MSDHITMCPFDMRHTFSKSLFFISQSRMATSPMRLFGVRPTFLRSPNCFYCRIALVPSRLQIVLRCFSGRPSCQFPTSYLQATPTPTPIATPAPALALPMQLNPSPLGRVNTREGMRVAQAAFHWSYVGRPREVVIITYKACIGLLQASHADYSYARHLRTVKGLVTVHVHGRDKGRACCRRRAAQEPRGPCESGFVAVVDKMGPAPKRPAS